MEEERYDPDKDTRRMLVELLTLMTAMLEVYWDTRRRVVTFYGNAPTPQVFPRLLSFLSKLDTVIGEQVVITINRES